MILFIDINVIITYWYLLLLFIDIFMKNCCPTPPVMPKMRSRSGGARTSYPTMLCSNPGAYSSICRKTFAINSRPLKKCWFTSSQGRVLPFWRRPPSCGRPMEHRSEARRTVQWGSIRIDQDQKIIWSIFLKVKKSLWCRNFNFFFLLAGKKMVKILVFWDEYFDFRFFQVKIIQFKFYNYQN